MEEDQIKNVFVFSVMRKVNEIDHEFSEKHSDEIIDFVYGNYELFHYYGVEGTVNEVMQEFSLKK